ncbi:hypothetical protein GF352_01675, partial|nr:hypothetical protein [archaeon]
MNLFKNVKYELLDLYCDLHISESVYEIEAAGGQGCLESCVHNLLALILSDND